MAPILYMVIPCYNEEKVLPITAPQFLFQLHKMQDEGLVAQESKILFVICLQQSLFSMFY